MATELKPAEQLDQLLRPQTPEGQEAIEKDETGTLKRLSERYVSVLKDADTETAKLELGKIVRELNSAGLFQPDPDRVWGTVDTRTFESRPQEQESQEQPQQTGPGVLEGLIKGYTSVKESPIAGKSGPVATSALHDLQEEELVRNYEDAIARGEDTEIGRLEKEALGMEGEGGLLQRQLQMAREHIGQLTDEQVKLYNIDRDKLAKDMAEQWAKRKTKEDERRQKPKTPEEKAAEEKRLRDELARATESGDKNKRVSAFRQLARHHISQTQSYSPFTHYYEIEEDGMMFPIQSLMRESILNMRRKRQEQQEQNAQAHAEEGLGRTQQQTRQSGGNRLLNLVRNAGKGEAKSLAKQGFKKLLSTAAKKALQKAAQSIILQPEVLIPILIIIAVIIAVLIIIVIIIAIINAINGQSQQVTPTPIPGLTLTLNTNPQGKTSYDNGQNIAFTIDATYTGTYSLILTDEPGDNAAIVDGSVTGKANLSNSQASWNLDSNAPLPDSTGTQKHWQFNLTFSQIGKDSVFHNVVVAQYAPGSGPSNSPPSGQMPQAGGSCAPGTLQKYFGSAGAGAIASCICKYESGGDPGVVNKSCTKGGTADWSVGLFQINLDTNPQRCPGAFSQVGNVCKIANISRLTSCTASLSDPVNNINAAVAIYEASHNTWDSGWHAEKGKCF